MLIQFSQVEVPQLVMKNQGFSHMTKSIGVCIICSSRTEQGYC